MKKHPPYWPLAAFLLFSSAIYGQSIGIGTTSPNASAQLDISSSSRGLLIPRMDSNAVKAIVSPAMGLMVYDSSRKQLLVNMGTAVTPDWENIVAKSGWSLTGNGGTGGIALLGTVDGNPLKFVVGGNLAGVVDGGYSFQNAYTTALGVNAVSVPLSSGAQESYESTAIGYAALQNGGEYDIAIGFGALQTNTGHGSDNIGIGSSALQNNSGYHNIAIGQNTLQNNSGSFNITIGQLAGASTTSGGNNTYVGASSGQYTTTGALNTAMGVLAMNAATTGSYNVAIGGQALQNTTQSWFNTVVGYGSGLAYDNGYNNVFVGANNDVNGAGYYNVIAIGQGVICTASSQARFGNSATNSIGGYANWTNFSDGRYKKNMREGVKGIDFIMRLRPIMYNLDVTGIRNHLGQKGPIDEGTQRSIAEREQEVLSGFAAQEVEAAASASGYDFSGVDKPKNANDFYGLRYGDFVVPLVKAVQEQQAMIKALQDEVAELKKQLQH